MSRMLFSKTSEIEHRRLNGLNFSAFCFARFLVIVLYLTNSPIFAEMSFAYCCLKNEMDGLGECFSRVFRNIIDKGQLIRSNSALSDSFQGSLRR